MYVIGLTGGIGSGKSQVAKILREKYQAKLLLADDIGRSLMQPQTPAFQKIIQVFGKDFLREDGQLDRDRLAKKVFADPVLKKRLENIVHPAVIAEIETTLKKAVPEENFFVIESAQLIEAGCNKLCDEIWYVSVTKELRQKRLAENRGYSLEKTKAIMHMQWSEKQYCSCCDFLLQNNGDRDILEKKIIEHMDLLCDKIHVK